MLTWIIQMTIISLILIFLVHHLIIYFTETLTVPKMKYLENNANKKYESIYQIISDKNNIEKESKVENNNLLNETNTTDIFSLPVLNNDSDNDMKNELKNFLKNQLNTKDESKEESLSFYQFK
jgi:hypothetical protein